jgi:GGDEF domain-containing protein
MEQFVIGFWGCYFGASALMLAGSALAYRHSLRRIARNAGVSALASAFFVVAFLGWLPIDDASTLARLLAHIASLVSALLAYQLFSVLGVLRQPATRRRTIKALAAFTVGVLALGWSLEPPQALAWSAATACLLGGVALYLAVRSAARGERLARVAVAGLCFMLLAVAGLSWIALDRPHVPWQVHVLSAVAATAYLASMATVLWLRYFYLFELKEVLAHGPGYDPVTRMRTHAETGNMVGAAFKLYHDDPSPLGMIVVTIANLYMLEKLYGLSAVNHALFVCAGRLRRTMGSHVDMGRLGDDGFLLLQYNCKDSGALIQLGRRIQAHLSKSVVLNTGLDAHALEHQQQQRTRWAADVGVGVLRVSKPDARAATSVAMGRGMSRTAWSYPSRVAWFDEKSGEIVAMSVIEPA